MPERQGFYRCETCNKMISEHDARVTYTLAAKFQDCTDGVFVNVIGEQGDQIVGVKGADFKHMREVQGAGPEQLRDLMNQCNFSYHTIVVRAKVDDYMGGAGGGDEVKFRYQGVRVQPMDFREENQMLLKRLELYQQKRSTYY